MTIGPTIFLNSSSVRPTYSRNTSSEGGFRPSNCSLSRVASSGCHAACANVEGIDLRDATVAALQELNVVTRPLHEAFDLLPVLIDLIRHAF